MVLRSVLVISALLVLTACRASPFDFGSPPVWTPVERLNESFVPMDCEWPTADCVHQADGYKVWVFDGQVVGKIYVFGEDTGAPPFGLTGEESVDLLQKRFCRAPNRCARAPRELEITRNYYGLIFRFSEDGRLREVQSTVFNTV